MNFFIKIKVIILASSRELFLKNYKEVVFRAEILAYIILANKSYGSSDIRVLKEITKFITNFDMEKSYIIEYITLDIMHKEKADDILKNILKKIKKDSSLLNKINTFDYEKLLYAHNDREIRAYQKNILNFFAKLKREAIEKNEMEKNEVVTAA